MGGRKLTQTQKKYIRQCLKENPDIQSSCDFSEEQWNTLEEMHDTEVLYQETNYYMEKLREKE